MNILVAKNGSQLGPFSESDIHAKLASGELAPSDFGWKEGMAAWSPLSQMFADAPPQAAPPAPVAPPPQTYSPQGQNNPGAYAPQPQQQTYSPQGQAPTPYAPQPYNAPQGQYSAPQTYNSPYPSPYQQGAVQQWGAQGAGAYAGFWLRFGALIIDSVLLLVLDFVVGFVLGLLLSLAGGASGNVLNVLGNVINVLTGLIYYTVMESSSNQATFGKMALGMKVTDLNGGRISFGRAIGRYFGKFVSAFLLFVGFFMAGFTERKQALHDIMAGTLVVRK